MEHDPKVRMYLNYSTSGVSAETLKRLTRQAISYRLPTFQRGTDGL